MSVSKRRSAIRAAGRGGRQRLQGADRHRAESQLVAHLASLHLGARPGAVAAPVAPSVGVFVAGDGEPDLAAFFDMLRSDGHQLALPVLSDDPADFTMRFWPWLESDRLSAGRYDIPVPPPREPVEPSVLLVPLVGFDSAANRMGRGAGFYDRYLATNDAYKVGVAFEVQRFATLETQAHDVSLDAIVTDLGLRLVQERSSDALDMGA